MKIERINENQFRCILTRNDLSERQIELRELAYGTSKARALFDELIRQAAAELDFQAEDIPIMVEAVPTGGEGIMLIVTKIEDPEELDTRFSRFTPSASEEEEAKPEEDDDFMELYRLITESKIDKNDPDLAVPNGPAPVFLRIFSFPDLDSVSLAASMVKKVYGGDSSLYKDPDNKVYYLSLVKDVFALDGFTKACHILDEYGTAVGRNSAMTAHFSEHLPCIIEKDAIGKLAQIK